MLSWILFARIEVEMKPKFGQIWGFELKKVSYGIKPLCILVSTATVGFTAFDRFSIVRAGLKVYVNSTKYILYTGFSILFHILHDNNIIYYNIVFVNWQPLHSAVIWMTSLFLSLPYLLNATLIQTDYEDNIHQCKINWGRLSQVFILIRISLIRLAHGDLLKCSAI